MRESKVITDIMAGKNGAIKSFSPMTYIVKSDTDENKEYLVTQHRPGMWRCTCRDYNFRSKTPEGYAKYPAYHCKHIKKQIAKLKKKNKMVSRGG